MKTINLLLALMISTLSFTQDVKDQFTILKELGEGAKIMGYYDLRDDGKGGKTASTGNPFTLEFIKNKFNKIYGFSGKYAKKTTGTAPNVCNENYTPDHHTKPAFFYNESTINPGIPTRKTNYFLIINKVIYFISGEYSEIKAGGNYSLKREIYYIKGSNQENSSSETSDSKTGKKKKKGLLKSLFGGGIGSGTSSSKIPSEITDRDHRAVIDAYLAKMEKIQADVKYTGEEQKELDEIREGKIEKSGKANAANAEFEFMLNQYVSLKNNTGHDLEILSHHYNKNTKEIYEASFHVSSGNSHSIYCQENAYIIKIDGKDVDKKLVYNKKTACRGDHAINFIP